MTESRQQSAMLERKFRLLFLFLLGYLILYPEAGNTGLRYYGFRTLATAITLLSVYAVSFRRTLVLFAVLLAIPTILQRTTLATTDASAIAILNYILSFAFDILIVAVLFQRVFTKEQVTSETIFGALCIYLLIGFGFSNLYMLVAAVQPHAFYLDPLVNQHALPDRFDLVFFSFGTMTSLGAAGITAASAQTRSLSVIEAILGVLYLAVLVSRLIGAYRSPAQPELSVPCTP